MPSDPDIIYRAFDALPSPVVVSNRDDGLILYANQRAAEVLGTTVEALVGTSAATLYPSASDRATVVDIILGKGKLEDHELRLARRDGSTFWALANSTPIESAGTAVLCTTFFEISADVRARAHRLAEAERRLATVLKNLPGLAYRCKNDPAWTVEFMSAGCEELTGFTPEDFVGNRSVSYADLILEQDRERVWDVVQAALKRREPFQLEYRIVTRGGDLKWVWEQGVGIFDETGTQVALEGIIHDVTSRHLAEQNREEMEQQMRAAQRMEAIGRLAGGVAHDFNNILTVVRSHADFLQDALRDGDPAKDDAREIADAADRAAHLTSQLLAFSRRQIQALAIVDLNEVVRRLDSMLRRLIGEHIELVTALATGPCCARVDVSQIEQVILNLVVNARDAMPNGGKLTIATSQVTLNESYGGAKDVKVPPGRYVLLTVSDTGTGMSEEVQANVFEPFFTTKEHGKGTGLGLSTVYGIVKQSDGFVWVYSEAGLGTSFEVLLPQSEGQALEAAPKHSPRKSGSETVLIVEDERAVRRAAARILKKHGYSVLEASHGGEALILCQRHPDPIELLLTDVVMPNVSGKELAQAVAPLRPQMRVLYMSGYTDGAIATGGVLEPGSSFLQKPFTPDALLAKVREVLDEKPQ